VKPEVFVGYSPATNNNPSAISESLARFAERFPYDDPSINLEAARLFAIAEHESPQLLAKIINQCTSESRLEDDIHYLIVASRLPGERTSKVTSATAHVIVGLHHKLAARRDIASRNWPLRIGELVEELCKKDDRLAMAIIDEEKFGLVEHSLFVSKLSGDTQVRAARKLLARVNTTGQDWDTDFLDVLKALPLDELRPFLHEKFNEPGLRDSIALILADSPMEQDRPQLVEALSSVQPNVVHAAAAALAKLNDKPTSDEIGHAVAALRQQTLAPNEKATRQELAELLTMWSGQKFNVEEKKGSDLAAAYRPWFDWFAKAHPEEAKKLTSFAGDLNAWNDRLAKIDWSTGDANRGKVIYEKRACHRCHSAAGRLGPDLAGAAARFSREDLFAAILDPNRDVAPLYQTTEVVTDAGQSYNGLIVYESPDTTMIQTGPDTVVRLTGVRKDGMRKSNVSLMPTGLLNEATDQDIVDLYEFLKTLKK
jgi:putative heme-binding domain-containing protein